MRVIVSVILQITSTLTKSYNIGQADIKNWNVQESCKIFKIFSLNTEIVKSLKFVLVYHVHLER